MKSVEIKLTCTSDEMENVNKLVNAIEGVVTSKRESLNYVEMKVKKQY